MAVLNTSGHARAGEGGSLIAAGVLFAALSLGGCVLQGLWGSGESEPGFDHQVHVVQEGLDCGFCHETLEGEELPSMPALDMCMLCHEGMDEDKPLERRAEAFFVGGEARPRAGALADELIFSHAYHVDMSGGDCLACHEGFDESVRVRPEDAISMDDCTSCHEVFSIDPACSTCHSEVGLDWAPPSHAFAWDKQHGQEFRARGEEVASRCDMCHEESMCIQCHQNEPPTGHDNFFRLRGHAIPASLDRARCLTCHRDDFCQRCHENVEPLSHKGMFGSPRNNHCLGCHFPLKNEGCITCHKGTPSHQLGAPQPPDHTPGANCRLCHGPSAPLPHADNGSQCSICHP